MDKRSRLLDDLILKSVRFELESFEEYSIKTTLGLDE